MMPANNETSLPGEKVLNLIQDIYDDIHGACRKVITEYAEKLKEKEKLNENEKKESESLKVSENSKETEEVEVSKKSNESEKHEQEGKKRQQDQNVDDLTNSNLKETKLLHDNQAEEHSKKSDVTVDSVLDDPRQDSGIYDADIFQLQLPTFIETKTVKHLVNELFLKPTNAVIGAIANKLVEEDLVEQFLNELLVAANLDETNSVSNDKKSLGTGKPPEEFDKSKNCPFPASTESVSTCTKEELGKKPSTSSLISKNTPKKGNTRPGKYLIGSSGIKFTVKPRITEDESVLERSIEFKNVTQRPQTPKRTEKVKELQKVKADTVLSDRLLVKQEFITPTRGSGRPKQNQGLVPCTNLTNKESQPEGNSKAEVTMPSDKFRKLKARLYSAVQETDIISKPSCSTKFQSLSDFERRHPTAEIPLKSEKRKTPPRPSKECSQDKTTENLKFKSKHPRDPRSVIPDRVKQPKDKLPFHQSHPPPPDVTSRVVYDRSVSSPALKSQNVPVFHSGPCGSCAACPYMMPTTLIKSNTGEVVPLAGNVTCSSIDVIYAIFCIRCKKPLCVNVTLNKLKTRLQGQISAIKTKKLDSLSQHFNSGQHTVRHLAAIGLEINRDKRKEEKWITLLATWRPYGLNVNSRIETPTAWDRRKSRSVSVPPIPLQTREPNRNDSRPAWGRKPREPVWGKELREPAWGRKQCEPVWGRECRPSMADRGHRASPDQSHTPRKRSEERHLSSIDKINSPRFKERRPPSPDQSHHAHKKFKRS